MPPRSNRTLRPSADPLHHLAPARVLQTALDASHVRGAFAASAIDPFALLHAEQRAVGKRGIKVGTVTFWAPELRRYVSTPGSARTYEVRYDAAAADRHQVTEIFFVVDPRRLRECPPIRCAPLAAEQETRNRTKEANAQWLYTDELRRQVEAAEVGSARLAGGDVAAGRQQAIHTARAHQGRAGQEQSGRRAPRPEVEQGVKAHAAEQLKRKLKNARQSVAQQRASRDESAPRGHAASRKEAAGPAEKKAAEVKASAKPRRPSAHPRPAQRAAASWGDVAAQLAADGATSAAPRRRAPGAGGPSSA